MIGQLHGDTRPGMSDVFFWVEDLMVYFFGSKTSARIFLGSNFRQANSSYAIEAKVPARSKSVIRIISSLVFFGVHNIRFIFWAQNVRLRRTPPPPPRHVYTRVPHLMTHVELEQWQIMTTTITFRKIIKKKKICYFQAQEKLLLQILMRITFSRLK